MAAFKVIFKETVVDSIRAQMVEAGSLQEARISLRVLNQVRREGHSFPPLFRKLRRNVAAFGCK